MMVLLLGQLWFTCVLSKTYMEMVQDHLNDSDDHSLIDFIWERRRATRIEALGPSLSLSLSLFLSLALALALALAPTLAPALPLAPALTLALALTLWSHTLPAAYYPRRETWIQLRRFEDVVQRQFEELRSSLVNRHGSKRDLSANMQPTPSSASLSTGPRT